MPLRPKHGKKASARIRRDLQDNKLTTTPEEPRRSGRATKGQHKNLELPDAPTKKGKSKSPKDKSSKASAEPTPGPSEGEGDGDEEEIIRCICGEYEEEEDVERDMICCDMCSAWQHNDCMGLVFAKGHEPDHYYCEQCRPENHRVLLDKIAKGEKPWEEVAERRRRELEEKKKRKKGGKKGSSRKNRPSESKMEPSTPVPTGTSATPGPTPVPGTSHSPAPVTPAPAELEQNGHGTESRRSSTNKRKLEETPVAEMEPKVKHQRTSSQSTAVRTSTVKTESPVAVAVPVAVPVAVNVPAPVTVATGAVEDLEIPARKSAASALVKLFVEQIAGAQNKSPASTPAAQSTEAVAIQVGLSIEDALYHTFCERTGEPTEAYKLQLRTILFNVKKNPSLRDRLLVGSLSPDSLSKMKSEEMASKELQQKDAEIKREAERQHIIIEEEGPRIRRTHKGDELIEDQTHAATESVFSTVPRRNAADSPGQSPVTPKLVRETEGQNRSPPPEGEHHDHVFPEFASNIREPDISGGKTQADAEIDNLLRDDEPDSPPYSPKDFDEDGTVWRGKVIMFPVSEFMSSAKHVAGADLSGRIPWSQLVPETLLIDGRIDIQLASNYLCGLRFSSSTDVSVIAISSPEHPSEREGFNKLFNYFQVRKRYGVIGKHPLAAVKDTYIVPIESGTVKPEFIELLENNSLDGPIHERMLLVVFVIKTSESNPPSVQPSSLRTSLEPAVSASPFTAHEATPQQPSSITANLPSSLAPAPMIPVPYGQYQPLQPLSGLPAAFHVLGEQVNAPAIQQLLKTAPGVDMAQLKVVRDILIRQPDAATNYQMLMDELFEIQANGHAAQAAV
ncbi:hypothetical protein N7495_004129 [Penicillium taxi]|uniref:uncharacterized protein n=1 Tax=Penicillium taxi TaxID=168475 RepID=UPI002544D50F|nr:uncharacterized protein N7495_004129 [Penicillium taxi]KAJ5899385.1 hypothetical protein N7495_004129 [Penicillium taxi]